MANKRVVEIASDICKPIIEHLGYQLIDIEYQKMHDGYHLIVTIDKDGGIDIQDCVAVHHAIDEPLDLADPTKGSSYHLDVSSCGLDRPLKKDVDYQRNLGKEIKVKFFKPFQGKKEIEGTLVSFTPDDFVLQTEQDTMTIQKNMVALAEPVIKF